MERLRLAIEGMSCQHCVRAVTGALQRVPGVRVEHVEIGTAVVDYEPGEATEAAIVEAVNDEGYEAVKAG